MCSLNTHYVLCSACLEWHFAVPTLRLLFKDVSLGCIFDCQMENNICNTFQSAYGADHSTETVVFYLVIFILLHSVISFRHI